MPQSPRSRYIERPNSPSPLFVHDPRFIFGLRVWY